MTRRSRTGVPPQPGRVGKHEIAVVGTTRAGAKVDVLECVPGDQHSAVSRVVDVALPTVRWICASFAFCPSLPSFDGEPPRAAGGPWRAGWDPNVIRFWATDVLTPGSRQFAQTPPPRLDTVSVSRFLDDAAEILDAAERSLAADLEPSDYTILIDPTGSMHILSDCDWPLDSLQREHGARTVYRVCRTGNSVRVEGREGSRSCVLESGGSRPTTPQPITVAPTWLLRQNCVVRQILVSPTPMFQTLPERV